MSIGSTTSSIEALQASPSGLGAMTDNNAVSRDDFLKLLVAQLQNQDPMNPTENQEFVAELATFSSLEQQEQQTDLLRNLLAAQNGSLNAQALSMIGKDVMSEVESFSFRQGQPVDFSFLANAGKAVVKVMTPSGRVVATNTMDLAEGGKHEFTFVGVNEAGQQIASGEYKISVESQVDGTGNSAQYPVFLRGAVDGVTFENGAPVLEVNGQRVDMAQVLSVLAQRANEEGNGLAS